MRVRKKIEFDKVGLYITFLCASLCLYFVLDNGEPLSLLLFYAMAYCHLHLLPSALIGFLPVLLSQNIPLILLYGGQTIIIVCGFLLHKKCGRTPFFPMLALCISLIAFVFIAPFEKYTVFTGNQLFENEFLQKTILSLLFFLLSAIFSVACKCLLRKILRCRLRGDERIFTVFSLLLVGVGFCRFFGVNAYMGAAFFFLLAFSYITKDTLTLLCGFCLSLPPFLIFHTPLQKLFILSVVIFLFARYGKLASASALIAAFFSYGYFENMYTYQAGQLVQTILSVVLPTLLFILTPNAILRTLENKWVFYREKHLSRIAINRNRATIGEKLFELSAVFREIQTTFEVLDEKEAETRAKQFVCNCVVDEVCKKCPKYPLCAKKNPLPSIENLVEIGCMKGKATLLDIPKRLGDLCQYQNQLLLALNRQIGEYKRYTTEAENTATGRALLAGQAQGVSEILKNLALEQSQPLRMHAEKERALNIALLNQGIVCGELLIFGEEDDLTVSLITFGKAEAQKIAEVVGYTLQCPMLISERLALSQDKFCCILRKKPAFDAAFGAFTVNKSGETHSGDSHSMIKIDERRFLVALADGMGSGDYARKISENTISLLESFYRAKMPPELTLRTVNNLLTFNREESFACVDIAVVDLDNGTADIVKIGSPLAFILSGNTVKVLESATLPLGILNCVRPDVSSYTLVENDVLLFISDGVTDAFGSTTDLYEVLRSIPANNPQLLAEALVQSALRAYGGKAKDDITALAVRLFKKAG